MLTRRERLARWLQDHVDPIFVTLGMVLAFGVAVGGFWAGSTVVGMVGVVTFLVGVAVFELGALGRP